MKKQIVNIINFVRGVEPREEVDLLLPVKKQIELLEEYDLPGTFLLQYDALIDERFTTLLKESTNKKLEIGLWFEVMKPLAEASGIVWRGRQGFDWDWHANVGFSVGYTKEDRKKLIDTMMERFKREFNEYPKSVGSWIIDAYSLNYMSEAYSITASCNCKDQWGTDGYTLWGGYYGQAYYPSKENAYTPAQTIEKQIPVPVFKMLGSDPIYQYDIGLNLTGEPEKWQQVVTLEPVYTGETGGGGEPKWVDWYFKVNYNKICINFAYSQMGQENSFGWQAMKNGLEYQIELAASELEKKNIEIMTLAESGAYFKSQYELTPPTAISALTDWKEEGRKSIWFNSKQYRVNIYIEDNQFWIRDWYIFDENYRENYLDQVCVEDYLVYDNLPIIDGNRWSGKGIRAGIYPYVNGKKLLFSHVTVEDEGNELKIIFDTLDGKFTVICTENELLFDYEGGGFKLEFEAAVDLPIVNYGLDHINFLHSNFSYGITIAEGSFEKKALQSSNAGRLTIYLRRNCHAVS